MAESEDEDEFFAKIDLEGICATAEKNEMRKRFAEVTQEKMDELLSDVQSKNTKYKTIFAANVFKGSEFLRFINNTNIHI